MALKPWYNVVTPREDLRIGKPLDAAEFAVHLDQVRLGEAPEDYSKPSRFFERTYMTKNLLDLSSQVVRRLTGETTETSAVYNLTTQFGGGKTHALTLLFHLASQGDKSKSWQGVDSILAKAGIKQIPKSATAVFVGTDFDSITGRGGNDGTPLRKTPWGEIAYQLNGDKGFAAVAEHERLQQAPAGDVIKEMLPKDKPCLILIDELINYSSRNRKSGLTTQLYDFLQNLSETARSLKNVVMVVSIPSSDLEVTPGDHEDFDRFKKMLDRLGKAMFMAAEQETMEIIRRRLFEWNGMPDDAKKTISEYVNWVQEFKSQIPGFDNDHARDLFSSCYPFHPSVISLFERKWQTLPRFQQTRGILRLLALWVSSCYKDGFANATKDYLIDLGSAPLNDSNFRSALFEQLGENRLEASVSTDISGRPDSHAERLDREATDQIKKNHLHKKIATAIFFESNGGQTSSIYASIPDIKQDIGGPYVDIGLFDQILQSLIDNCYYLNVDKNRYKFSTKENLIKRFSDRRASIKPLDIDERVKEEIKKVFDKNNNVDKVLFPEKNGQITDKPSLQFIILKPEYNIKDKKTIKWIDDSVKNNGQSARVYKSGLIFVVSESDSGLKEDSRRLLAWEEIYDEAEELNFDESQLRSVKENVERAKRDIKEQVWKTYKNLVFLEKNNDLQTEDMGLMHTSMSKNIIDYYVSQLISKSIVSEDISANFLLRNWPPAFIDWSTKNVRDAFFASPKFPKLLKPEAIRLGISRGISSGLIAYVGKKGSKYDPFYFEQAISPDDIEISDDIFIINAEVAKKNKEPKKLVYIQITPDDTNLEFGKSFTFTAKGLDQHKDEFKLPKLTWEATGGEIDTKGVFKAGNEEGTFIITASAGDISGNAKVYISKKENIEQKPKSKDTGSKIISWSGLISPQKWMVFYTKVLSKFSTSSKLKITVKFEIEDSNISDQKIEEAKSGLKELDMDEEMRVN